MDFFRIFFVGTIRAGDDSTAAAERPRISLPPNFLETTADDLDVFAQQDPLPDLIAVAAHMVRLMLWRLQDAGDALPYILVEAMETLAEDNEAVGDFASAETVADIRFMIGYLDTDDESQMAVLRMWLSQRIYQGGDAGTWTASDHALAGLEQLSFDQLSPGAPHVQPDAFLLSVLMPPPEMPRAMVAAAMTDLTATEARDIAAAAGVVAAYLRERGFSVHEPTAVSDEGRSFSTVEAVDLDRLAKTDLLVVLGYPGATGIGVLLGRATHSAPLRIVFTHPNHDPTPLLDHVSRTGGAVYRACDPPGLHEHLAKFLRANASKLQMQVERRLGWSRYGALHDTFVRAVRAARATRNWQPPFPLSNWRLAQLERLLEHFAQAGVEELSVLAESLQLPEEWRAELVGLRQAPIDVTTAEPVRMPDIRVEMPAERLFSVEEIEELFRAQAADARPTGEAGVLLRRAAVRRRAEDLHPVGRRNQARLDAQGWRSLRTTQWR